MRLALPVVKMSMKSHETSPSHCGWHSASGSQRTRSLPPAGYFPPPTSRPPTCPRSRGRRSGGRRVPRANEVGGGGGSTGTVAEIPRGRGSGRAAARGTSAWQCQGRRQGPCLHCSLQCRRLHCRRQAAAPDTSLRAREFARERSACHSGSASARDCLPLPGSGRHSTPSRCAPGAQAFGIPRVSAARRDSCQPELGLRRGAGGLCRAEPASAAAPSCGTARPAKAAL